MRARKGPVQAGDRARGGPGGRPPEGIAVHGEVGQRPPSSGNGLPAELMRARKGPVQAGDQARRSPNPVLVKAGKRPAQAGDRARGGPGGRPPEGIAGHGAGGQRPPSSVNRLVGEEGFEPSRPRGHTDLNRARLPFRHPPGQRVRLARPHAYPHRRYDRMRAGEGGTPGGSATALRAKARRHG